MHLENIHIDKTNINIVRDTRRRRFVVGETHVATSALAAVVRKRAIERGGDANGESDALFEVIPALVRSFFDEAGVPTTCSAAGAFIVSRHPKPRWPYSVTSCHRAFLTLIHTRSSRHAAIF